MLIAVINIFLFLLKYFFLLLFALLGLIDLKVLNNRITNQKKLAETISIEIMLSNKEITKIAKKINTIRQQITQKSKHIEALKAEYAKMIYSQQRNKLNNNVD